MGGSERVRLFKRLNENQKEGSPAAVGPARRRLRRLARAPGRRLIAGLVLAAGGGSRFGGPKQLADLNGRPLLEHVLETIARAALGRRSGRASSMRWSGVRSALGRSVGTPRISPRPARATTTTAGPDP